MDKKRVILIASNTIDRDHSFHNRSDAGGGWWSDREIEYEIKNSKSSKGGFRIK